MVSRVGRDDLGQEIRSALAQRGLTDAFLQEDPDHPTGTVHVTVGDDGQPQFTITEDVAFDHLTPEPPWDALFGQAVAVCFGTLVQRDRQGRARAGRGSRSARETLAMRRSATSTCDNSSSTALPWRNRSTPADGSS